MGLPAAMTTVIDFHMHYTPRELVESRLGPGGRPAVIAQQGIPSSTLHEGLFRIDRHLECMDAAGVDVAVLSSGAGMGGDTVTCATVNAALAKISEEHPARFMPLAHIDPRDQAWKDELTRCIGDYGFTGLAFPSSFADMPLDSPVLLPVYKAVAEAGLFVFVHPALAVPPRLGGYYDAYDLYRCVGREHELIVATYRLIAGGVFDQVPGLTVVMSHLGGGLAAILERIRGYQDKSHMGLPPSSPHAQAAARPFDHYIAHNLYFDTGGLFGSVKAIRAALTEIPAGRIVFGSDYPQEIRDAASLARFTRALQDSGLPRETIDGILRNNGAALLKQTRW
jgi:predicted TIM-barrel fold metal-dependent hydrolase